MPAAHGLWGVDSHLRLGHEDTTPHEGMPIWSPRGYVFRSLEALNNYIYEPLAVRLYAKSSILVVSLKFLFLHRFFPVHFLALH